MVLVGGGTTPDSGLPASQADGIGSRTGVRLLGSDPFVMSLEREPAGGEFNLQLGDVASANFGDVAGARHAVVELSPMTGPAGESLASLEETWFAPARAALAQGSLASCDVIANDRWFRVVARPAYCSAARKMAFHAAF